MNTYIDKNGETRKIRAAKSSLPLSFHPWHWNKGITSRLIHLPFGQRPIKGASDEALIDQAKLEVPSSFSREGNEFVMHSSCIPPRELIDVVVDLGEGSSCQSLLFPKRSYDCTTEVSWMSRGVFSWQFITIEVSQGFPLLPQEWSLIFLQHFRRLLCPFPRVKQRAHTSRYQKKTHNVPLRFILD